MARMLALVAMTALAPSAASSAKAWAQVAPMDFGRSDSSAAVVNGLVYVAGGCDGAQDCNGGFCSCTSLTIDFSAFDPAANAWTRLTPLPQPRYRHSACVWRDAIYLFGGRTLPADAIITAVDVYNTTSGAWSTLAGAAAYPADYGVGSDNTCVTVNDTIYVMGGYTSDYSVSLNATYTFSPATGVWARRAGSLRTGRGDFTGAALGGLVYVYGGYSAANFCAPLASTEVYSPAADAWTPGPDLPTPGAEKDDGVVVDGGLLAIGGETKRVAVGCVDPDIVPLRSVYAYVPGPGAGWVNASTLPDGRMRFSAAAVGGVVYVFGGQALPIDGGYEIPLLYSVLSYAPAPAPSPSPAAGGNTYYGYTASELGGALAGMFLGVLLLVALVVAGLACARSRRARAAGAAAASSEAAASAAVEKPGEERAASSSEAAGERLAPEAAAAAHGAGGPRLSEIVVAPDVLPQQAAGQ